MTWKPIETAPKDEVILAWMVDFEGESMCSIIEFNGVDRCEWANTGEEFGISWFKPTHWMPLPEPPR